LLFASFIFAIKLQIKELSIIRYAETFYPCPGRLSRKSDIEKLRKEIDKVESRKSNLQKSLLDDEITPQDYQDMKKDIDKDLMSYKTKLESLTQEMTPCNIHLLNHTNYFYTNFCQLSG
jgi:SMC interacting uncharacterized protein involved in chromosome segregation